MLSEIKVQALRQLAREGAGALSLREVAREVGVVSSGLYRYFGSRDELLTALIIDAYADLATAVSEADRSQPRTRYRRRWGRGCQAFRDWALGQPHRFLLLYGSPVPGYAAPAETIEPAAAVIVGLLQVVGDAAAAQVIADLPVPRDRILRGQLDRLATALDFPLATGSTLQAVRAFAELAGLVTLELNGQFVGGFEPADQLFTAAVDHLADQLGLPPARG